MGRTRARVHVAGRRPNQRYRRDRVSVRRRCEAAAVSADIYRVSAAVADSRSAAPPAPAAPEPLSALIPGFTPPPDGRVRGVVVAGVDDPRFVDRLLSALPALADGYETPVYVVDPRAAVGDAVRASARVRVFAGADGVARFLADRRSAIGLSLPRYVTSESAAGAPLMHALRAGLDALAAEQVALDGVLRARVNHRSLARGTAHWGGRFAAIGAGQAPARVLILTSRYSTFVRHAAEDLAVALGEIGHQARVLMEPDAHATLTSCYYLDEIERFDPDLIVGINYPRAAMGNALPEGIPYVCWIQDAMPHLFTATARASALDFIAGHVYPSLIARQGYAPHQVLEHFVPVSAAKFHPGTTTRERESRFTCDIAYVSHRSETPAAFHAKFLADPGIPRSAVGVIERCRESVSEIVARWPREGGNAALRQASEALAAGFGKTGEARVIDLLHHQYVVPLCEQMLRHETLEWAAAIAREQRLALKIFGKGWERHPTLGEFAAGPLEHGEDLRACYTHAACHLHASTVGSGHQRVYECAMSGGVPLSRRSWDEMYFHDWAVSREFVLERLPPDEWRNNPRWPMHAVANHPRLMQLVRNRQRMGAPPCVWDHEFYHGLYAHIESQHIKPYDGPVPPAHTRPFAILGDMFETVFSTHDELRERVLLAAERGSWREQVSAGIGARARDAVGMSRFARRVIDLVGSSLALGGVRQRAPAAAGVAA